MGLSTLVLPTNSLAAGTIQEELFASSPNFTLFTSENNRDKHPMAVSGRLPNWDDSTTAHKISLIQ